MELLKKERWRGGVWENGGVEFWNDGMMDVELWRNGVLE